MMKNMEEAEQSDKMAILDILQEAIDTCPVDCIHWVKFQELEELENSLDRDITIFR